MAVGDYRHAVTFQNPGPPVPDGDGGFSQSWIDLVPAAWRVSIEPATARALERVGAGTVTSAASHIVTGRYHPDVTTQTRMLFNGREFSITGMQNLEERGITMQLVAVEQVP